MIRLAGVLAIVFCCLFTGMAQSTLPDVKWGNTSTYTKVVFRDFLGEDEDGIYMLMVQETVNASKYRYYVEKYSTACAFVKRVEIVLSEEKDRSRFIDALYANGKIYFLTAKWDEGSKKRKLYRQEIDTKTMMKKGQPVVMAAVDPTSGMKTTAGMFYLRRSLDGSKILVINEPAFNSESLKDRSKYYLRAFCFDEDMNELWSQEVNSPYHATVLTAATIDYLGERDFGGLTFGKARGQNYYVDNDGNMRILYQLGRNFKQPDAEFILRSFFDKGTKAVDTKMFFAGKKIEQVAVGFLADGTARLAGFYSNEADKGSGILSATYDATTGKKISQGLTEFDDAFVNQFKKFWVNGSFWINNGGLPNVYLDWLIINDDGSIIVTGEEAYYPSNYSNNPEIKLHDIITFKLSANHKVDWIELLPKRHNVSPARAYWASYEIQVRDDGTMHILYNDNADNLPEPNRSKPAKYNHEQSVLVMATISPNGEVTKQILFKNEDLGVVAVPKLFWQTSENEMLMVAFLDAIFKTSDSKVGRLTFK